MDMKQVELNGAWRLAKLTAVPAEKALPQLEGLDWLNAKPPRAIHYDLMEAGVIPNVYHGTDNAKAAAWVSESDWVYQTHFDLSKADIAAAHLLLCFECVDTFTDIFVNGAYAGSTDNMFMPWKFELSALPLREKGNELIVHMKAHNRMVADRAEEAATRMCVSGQASFVRTRALVRRYQRSYNETLMGMGAPVIGMGIVRRVWLEAKASAFIQEYDFAVKSIGETARVAVSVCVDDAKMPGAALTAIMELKDKGGAVAASVTMQVQNGKAAGELLVKNPKLWWPLGYGEAYLYDLSITLLSGEQTLDQWHKRAGIRTVSLTLKRPNGRHDFCFVVNGKRIYVFGGDWVPIDILNGGGSREQNLDLLRTTADCHMNMLRLWGGGMQEEEYFYDACDEMGIMIYKDAHTHSAVYPDYDAKFVSDVVSESRRMIRDLRVHPCFAVFCGGNEQQEGWDAWGWRVDIDEFFGAKLLYEILPKVAQEECPDIPYIPNSPYGEKLSQSPVDGDTHTWGNFYNAVEDPLFISETCWYQGTISRKQTLEKWMGINVDDFKGKHWDKPWKALTSQSLEHKNQYSEYHMLDSLEDYIRCNEIEQFLADYHALYLLRCRSSSCNGIIYWPLNKGGPMFMFGLIDYDGLTTKPYYVIKRLFRHQVVHIYRDVDDLRVVAANAGEAFKATLVIKHVDSTGKVLMSRSVPVEVGSGNSNRLYELDGYYQNIANRWREAVHVALVVDGVVISEDCVFFCPWFEFEIEKDAISVSAMRRGDAVAVTVNNKAFAKLIECDASVKGLWDDAEFTMLPGTREIVFTPSEKTDGPITISIRSLDGGEPVNVTV